MNDFLQVSLIASLAAFLTYLGAPLAEKYILPQRVISAVLQFAAGIIVAMVAISLMPPAVLNGPLLPVVIAFFLGGAIFVLFEYFSTPKQSSTDPAVAVPPGSWGLYIGILLDLFIDGVLIGVGSTLTLKTGVLLAIALSLSTLPLAYVTIATARQRGMPREQRRLLGFALFGCMLVGAWLGFLVLGNLSQALRLSLIALASGFLITMVTQSLIPEANREGEPGFAGILFVGGISIYTLLTLALA
jgi:ZIP family zinc transporter